MKLSRNLLLALASLCSFSFFSIDSYNSESPEINELVSLQAAIAISNEKVGTDSVYLSSLVNEYEPNEYLISDHLVLVNDVNSVTNLLSQDITFSVAPQGNLELVDFNLKSLEARINNEGSMSLVDCLFQEGNDLTKLISNQGAFSIMNGLFEGSNEGDIIRDAVFKHSTRVIL